MDPIVTIHLLAVLFSFFVGGAMLGAAFSKTFRKVLAELVRSSLNPILVPGTNPWTAEAVFNPAAAVLSGRTHLVYRAIGADGVSRLCHASSEDGILFDERPPYPIFVAQDSRATPYSARRYNPVVYPSGGSWGGCEDPRMVEIEGRVYVTYNMFDNWTLRVGCISMPREDFLAKRFYKWTEQIILSHGARDKNWVLFPEKIRGQFAVLHSIIGDTDDRVRIEYTDDLASLSKRKFESPDPHQASHHPIAWHVRVRSAGPPPLRTNRGWLVFYHAHDAQEPHRYKVGAMLLDLADPTKILCRAALPVLSPDEHYENNGKPGVVYLCGAVVRPSTALGTSEQTLFVYYGGADKVICVATAPLEPFLDALVHGDRPSLITAPAQTA